MKDYQLRFCYEYYNLKEKASKLEDLLFKAHNNKLDFELNCPVELLQQQYLTMCKYMQILESRASFEHINLEEWCNEN